MKDITGKALRVNPNQRRARLHIAHDEHDSFLNSAVAVDLGMPAKSVDTELAPASWEISGGDLFNYRIIHTIIISSMRAAPLLNGTRREPDLERQLKKKEEGPRSRRR